MGCSNSLDSVSLNAITSTMGKTSASWNPVPTDIRYEEKAIQKSNGGITRMTAVIGERPKDSDYPHVTEFHESNGEKRGFYSDKNRSNWKGPTLWDSHYSTPNGKQIGCHRTSQSILDDLNEAIDSMRSERK